MKALFVLLFCIHVSSSVRHSWKAFYSGSTGLKNFPEFVALNVLDDEVMGYFDSRTNKFESRQAWMTESLGQEYEERQTNTLRGHVPTFKVNVGIAMERFNQSKGVHIVQMMVGCEWDDKTGPVRGFWQEGYDGEDFISFDLKTETFIAPKPQAVITKQKWDKNIALIAQRKFYLTQQCPEWLKQYVDYGKDSLMRTDLPSVSLLQKNSSSPVRCFATGFYPKNASLFWRRDGVEIHEDVEHREILPNQDGTFQMSVDLDVSSVKAEDWGRLDCVFQLSGVKEDMVTRLDRAVIKTSEDNANSFGIIIGIVAALVLLAIAVIGFLIYRKKNDKRPPSSVTNREVEVEVQQPLNQMT